MAPIVPDPKKIRSFRTAAAFEHIARLTAAGRMTEHGQRQVDAAKADGRWDAAYAPIRSATVESIPADLRAAIEASPKAKKTFDTRQGGPGRSRRWWRCWSGGSGSSSG